MWKKVWNTPMPLKVKNLVWKASSAGAWSVDLEAYFSIEYMPSLSRFYWNSVACIDVVRVCYAGIECFASSWFSLVVHSFQEWLMRITGLFNCNWAIFYDMLEYLGDWE